MKRTHSMEKFCILAFPVNHDQSSRAKIVDIVVLNLPWFLNRDEETETNLFLMTRKMFSEKDDHG